MLGYDQSTDDQKDAISSFLRREVENHSVMLVSVIFLLLVAQRMFFFFAETMAWLTDRPGTSGKFVTAPNHLKSYTMEVTASSLSLP